jgi:hypothetical protein
MSIVSGPIAKGDLLQAALAYAGRGWPIFPVHTIFDGKCTCDDAGCESVAKHPILPNGFQGACVEPATIERWWEETQMLANVGIRTGPESGLWVLDADGAEGIKALADLEAEYGTLPETPTVRTGGGGMHKYFTLPAGVNIKCATRIAGKRLDVRGSGGYVLAPPSLHASGNRYEWITSIEDVSLAAAPEWLVEWSLQQPSPAGNVGKLKVVTTDLATAPGVEQGRRHREALRLIGSSLWAGQPADAIRALALAWADRCTPPLPADEVLRIVDDLAVKDAARSTVSNPAWEPPTPFHEYELPGFPTAALPGWLRAYVEAEATATQTPADLAGMLVLTVVAAACAKTVKVVIGGNYAEPLNIFTAVALPPANRKSAVFAEVMAPLTEFEREEVRRLGPEIAEAKARRAIDEARLSKLQTDAAKAKTAPEQESLIQQAAELARKIAEGKIPVAPRFVASDTTAERLATLLAENGGRMAVMSPEGDVFDQMAGRYGGGNSANFGVYLNGHAGDDLRVDRVIRSPEFVSQPALTLGVAVQPEVIRGLAGKPGFRGRGLLARFLYALPVSLVGTRDPDPPPMPELVRSGYRNKVLALLNLASGTGADGEPVPWELSLGAAARQRHLELLSWLEPQLAEGGALEHINDWGGKLAGAVLRIAGILHMAEHAGEPAPWSEPISIETMEGAVAIGEYLIAHAHAAFGEMGADPTIEAARYVLAWLKRRGARTVKKRDLFEGTKGRFKRVDALQPALGLLIGHDYIREQAPVERPGPGRKPSPTFELNPLVLEQKSQDSQKNGLEAHPTSDVGESANPANCTSETSVADQAGIGADVAGGGELDPGDVTQGGPEGDAEGKESDPVEVDQNVAAFGGDYEEGYL